MATQSVILLILAEVLMMVISGCGGGGDPVVPPKLTAHVSTEKDTFGRGEAVRIDLEIRNSSSSSSSFSFDGESAMRIVVTRNTSKVFETLSACISNDIAVTPSGDQIRFCESIPTLGPGESKQFISQWSQQELNSAVPAAAGSYQIQAFVTEIDGNSQRAIASNVVSVEITP